MQIFEKLLLGIEEERTRQQQPTTVRILQNPVRGNYIGLFLNSGNQTALDLELYNLLGQKIKTYSFPNLKAGRNILRMDTQGLPSGTYFLKMENELSVQPIKVIFLK